MAGSTLWDTLAFRQSGTLRATTTRQFDSMNRLRSIKALTVMAVSGTNSPTTTGFLLWTSDFLRQYIWGLDLSGTVSGAGGVGGLLWVRPSGGAAHFAAYDGNGNVVALIDGSTGSASARYEYDP